MKVICQDRGSNPLTSTLFSFDLLDLFLHICLVPCCYVYNMNEQLTTQEIRIISHLNDETVTISKSFRNTSERVNVGETVFLNNEKEQVKVLAEVVSLDANWTASFKIIKQ